MRFSSRTVQELFKMQWRPVDNNPVYRKLTKITRVRRSTAMESTTKPKRALWLVAALIAGLLVSAPIGPVSAQSAEISAGKSAPGTLLAGEPLAFTITAANPGGLPLFNISLRDELAPGVSYVPGSATPQFGEPEVIVNQVPDPLADPSADPAITIPQETLIWSNVADLQPGSSLELSFSVTLNDTLDPDRPSLPAYVVGASVANSSSSYGSPDERVLARFDPEGAPIPDPAVATASSSPTSTLLTAVDIEKSEPSPEGELLRGVHLNTTEYRLDVRITDAAGVENVTVTDYLPASLEFLGCGGVDNSADVEYLNAPSLTATPPVSGCVFPDSVETVVDPPADGTTVYPPGVYTKLTWSIDPSQTGPGGLVSLPYAAGIPLQANVAFPDGTSTTGVQASNLDNNTGASTRETASERAVTNVARVSGTYNGPLAPGVPTNEVFDVDRLTRTIEDVRMRKSIVQPTPNRFQTGALAIYQVTINVSEYVDASGIVITDQFPNGLCPLSNVSYASSVGTQCGVALGSANPNLPTISVDGQPATPFGFASVTPTGGDTGGFTAVFDPIPDTASAADGTIVIQYRAEMNGRYEGGDLDDRPPVSGDSFTNQVSLDASTTPIPNTPESGTIPGITDGSNATLVSGGTTIDKRLRPRGDLITPGTPCPEPSANDPSNGPTPIDTVYIDPETVDPADAKDLLGFRLGDEVCFLLRVDFDPTVRTRNAVITDFLPIGVEVVAGSLQPTANNDVPFELTSTPAGGPVVAALGTDDPLVDGDDRFVDLGASSGVGRVFEVVFKTVVVDTPDGDAPLITGNLMKMRTENSAGDANSFRDRAGFAIVPAPPMELLKGVASVDTPAFTASGPDEDDIPIQQGSIVGYRIDITNGGSVENFNDFSTRGFDLWDILPDRITCADVVPNSYTAFGEPGLGAPIVQCTDPGDLGHPTFVGNTVLSAIRWNLATDSTGPGGVDRWTIDDGDSATLTYQVVIPTPTSIGTNYINDAALRSYDSFTNQLNNSASYFPEDNIDSTVTPEQENAPAAADDSNIRAPGAVTTKIGVTGIVEDNNDLPTQAVPGETITYTIGVEIPPQVTVFEAALEDLLPSQLEIVSPAPVANFYPDASSPTTAAFPAPGFGPNGFALDADTGALTFPRNPDPTLDSGYQNDTTLTQRFEVVISTRVRPSVGGQPNISNTARFLSVDQPGGTPVATPIATYQNQIIQANPSIRKSNDAEAGVVRAGQQVTYTLTARNRNSSRPPAHDVVVSDCIPEGLTFVEFTAPVPSGTTGPVAGNPATNGCETDETFISFDVGTVEAGSASDVERSYLAEVEATAVGGTSYTNTASIVGSSLDNGDSDDTVERVYSPQDATNTVTVPGTATVKTVDPDNATIGELVTYTVVVNVPRDVNFYQAAVVDRLPVGLDPSTFALLGVGCVAIPNPDALDPPACNPAGTLLDPVTQGDDVFVGVYFDDITSEPYERIVTVRYSARLAEVDSNVAGATVTNLAQAVWDDTDSASSPTTPLFPWTNRGIEVDADVLVTEPSLSIEKSVSDETPEPGQGFTYTIELDNAAGADVSAGYNAVITDDIPVGVSVIESSISPTPTSFNPASAVAPGTIVWGPGGGLAGPFEPGSTTTLTYDATFTASFTLGPDPKVNTAELNEYEGLPASEPAGANRREYTGNVDDATVTPDFPELSTVKTAVDGEPTYIGDAYTWRVVATNIGPGAAFGVSIDDLLPENWEYVANSATVTFPDTTTSDREPTTGAPCPTGRQCWFGLGNLEPGASVTLEYQSRPLDAVVDAPGVGSAIRQVNTAGSDGTDRTGASRNLVGPYASDDVTASTRIDEVDLLLDKSHPAAAPPVAGEEFSWTIDVSNLSTTDTAVGEFSVIDTLPTTPGVEFVSAAGSGWTCVPATGPTVLTEIECTQPGTTELAPGAALPPITVTFDIPSDLPDGTIISNTAVVDGRTYEAPANLADNTDTDPATVTTLADLEVVKTLADPPGLVAGTDATYRLRIANNGPSTSRATAADPIVVVDTLPAGVSFVSAGDTAASPTWTCAHDLAPTGGDVTCERETDLLDGDTSTIEIVVSIPSSATGDLTNAATITPAITTDPVSGNNTSEITNPIIEETDLEILKSALGPAVPGEPTTYRLSVTNNGPGDASVRIQDELPTGLTYRSFSNVAGDWSCAASTAPDPVPGFRCDLTGRLAFTSPTLNVATVDVVVDTDPSVTGTVNNTATVSTTAVDTDDTNDTDDADLTFEGVADLALTKTSTGTGVPGGPITWTIDVENLGPSDSQSPVGNPIRVTDALPDGIIGPVTAEGAAATDDWSCDIDDTASPAPAIDCTKATLLAAGDTTSITITAVIDPATPSIDPIVNSATVTPFTAESNDPTDPKTANNADTDEVRLAEPSVEVVKSVDIADPQPGDTFEYTLELSNTGDAPAYNLEIVDQVPAGIVVGTIDDGGALTGATPVTATTAGGIVVNVDVGGTITWDATDLPGPLAPGDTISVTYEATLAPSPELDPTDTDDFTNTATLEEYFSLPTGGREYAGNDSDAVVAPRFPSLSITKTALGDDPTYLNTDFSWSITVTNDGAGDAGTVSVTDVLPQGWDYVSGRTVVSAPGGITDPDPDTITADPAGDTLEWDDLGPLLPGQSLTVTIVTQPTLAAVDPPPFAGVADAQVNTASAQATDAADFDQNAVDDYDSDEATAEAFIAAADLVITKSNAATPATAGEEYTWTVDVRNLGPDEAVGPFLVTDTLPAIAPDPLAFVSATGTGWTCTEAAGIVSCSRTDPTDTLASGASFETISVTVAIPSDFISNAPGGGVVDGPLVNVADVGARTFDPELDNNDTSVETPVGGSADLSIVKNHTETDIIAGRPVTFTFDVTNAGPSTARADIVVVDTLPDDLVFVTAPAGPGGPWDCSFTDTDAIPGGGAVTCTLRDATGPLDLLAGVAAPQLSIVTQVLPGATPDVAIGNSATVTSPTPDPDSSNNTDADSVTPRALADLAITKILLDPDDFTAGEEATFRLSVTNFGPSDAEAIVRIVDDLPDGLTFVRSANVTGTWACTSPDDDVVTCDLDGGLVLGETAVVDIVVLVDSGVTGTIENVAEVQSLTTTDPIVDNNTDNEIVGVDTEADLGIVKTSVGETFLAGEDVTWELVVANGGPSDSQPFITVTDTLPDSLTFVSALGTGWICTTAPSGAVGFSDTITCVRNQVLAAGDLAPTITVVATIGPDAGPSTIFNTAVVSGTTEDNNPNNDTSTDSVNVIDRADLAIVKSPENQTVRAGEDATFTLAVTNNGPSTADIVIVADDLPAGMTVVSATGTNWNCTTPTAVRISCSRATLDPGAAEEITVVASVGSGVPDGTTLINRTAVSASTPDDDDSNNVDDADVVVEAEADLAITKVHPSVPDRVLAGTDVEFTIDVVNNGPSDAVGPITVTDTLPDGFSYLSVRGPWTCAPDAGDQQIIDCTLVGGGGLVAGQAAGSLLMLVAVDATADDGEYVNTARVDSPTIDPIPSNDVADDTVNVGSAADLSITKTHVDDDVRIFDEFDFTLRVSNAGPSEARDVVVTDVVPTGLTVVAVAGALSPSSWTCDDSAAPTVSCALNAPLAPGATAEDIVLTVSVEPEAFPLVENTAVVTTSTFDNDLDNNTSTDPVPVPRLVDLFVEKRHAGPVAVGEPIVYTLLVGNNGPIDDDAVVTVVDAVPASLEVTDATSAAADCGIADNVVTCTKDDGLAVDETFEITITADVLPAAYPLVINVADVSSPTDDVDPANNTDADPAVVPPLTDLAITKSHTGEVQVGGEISYDIVIVNNGPTPAPGPIRMLDTLPGSLTPVSATSNDMSCSITGQTVSCQTIGPLAVDGTLEITVVADVGPAAFPSVENTVTVTSPGCADGVRGAECSDTDLSNNTDTDVATVTPFIRLALDKTLAGQVGSSATWAMVVTNVGSNATVDPVRLTDELPNTLSFVSANGAGWVCSNSGQTVGCTYAAAIEPGASAPTLNIVTLIDAAEGTEITNVAVVDGGGPDVPSVTDPGDVVAPALPPLPETGGGPGILLQWAPTLLLLGLALALISRRRRELGLVG